MGEFLGFVMILFAAVWGSMFLHLTLKRFRRDLEPRPDDVLIEGLREDTQQLEARLSRVEEELDFFRNLHAPKAPERLPPAEEDDETAV